MPGDGGEAIRAVFQAAKEEAAQAAEDAGQAIAKFTNETTENVLDSIQAIENADGASADATRGIRVSTEAPANGSGSESGGRNPISALLNGDPRLSPGTPEYDAYIEALAKDPAKNGKITAATRREAVVGVQAEADGDIPGPLRRAPFENNVDRGEFVDSTGQHWDVKSSPDIAPDYSKQAGQPIQPQSDARFARMVNKELGQNINVLLDPHGMSPARLAHLKEVVASHSEWGGKVVWGR